MYHNVLAVAVAGAIISTAAYSGNLKDRVVGLEQAKHFHSQASMDYFVRAGAFSSKSNALRYQKDLQRRLHEPVSIRQAGGYNLVLIGPVNSSAKVRMIAQSISGNPGQVAKMPQMITPRKAPIQNRYIPPAEHTVVTVDKDGFLLPSPVLSGIFIGMDIGGLRPTIQGMRVNNGLEVASPLNLDNYTVHNNNHLFLGGTVGYRIQRMDTWLPAYSFGLRYRHIFSREIGGFIFESSLPEFRNYSYNLNMTSNTLMAVGKIDIARFRRLMPYLSGGLGVAWNKMDSYSETALPDVTPRITPAYKANSQTEFAWTLGAGLDIQFNPALTFTIGYEYQNLGRFSTGYGVGTWSQQRLVQHNVRTNGLLLGMDYLFAA